MGRRVLWSVIVIGSVAFSAGTAADSPPAKQPGPKSKEALKKFEVSFSPAEAKPGQTVLMKINVELAEGYHTYPVVQPAPEAMFQTNKITFPTDGPIIFVSEVLDPGGAKSKKEEDHELLYFPGGGVWSRRAVVSPLAKPGPASAKIKFRILICDKDNCFPPKAIDGEATIKVLEGPAVEVDKAYKADVEKALKKK